MPIKDPETGDMNMNFSQSKEGDYRSQDHVGYPTLSSMLVMPDRNVKRCSTKHRGKLPFEADVE